MNHSRLQIGHMWLITGAAVAAILLGYGIGWTIAIALIGCSAMLVVLVWVVNSDRDRHDRTGVGHGSHHDEVGRAD